MGDRERAGEKQREIGNDSGEGKQRERKRQSEIWEGGAVTIAKIAQILT